MPVDVNRKEVIKQLTSNDDTVQQLAYLVLSYGIEEFDASFAKEWVFLFWAVLAFPDCDVERARENWKNAVSLS